MCNFPSHPQPQTPPRLQLKEKKNYFSYNHMSNNVKESLVIIHKVPELWYRYLCSIFILLQWLINQIINVQMWKHFSLLKSPMFVSHLSIGYHSGSNCIAQIGTYICAALSDPCVLYGLRVNPSEIPVSSLGSVNLLQSVIFGLLRLFLPVNIQYIIKGKFRNLEYQARIVKLKKTVSHF